MPRNVPDMPKYAYGDAVTNPACDEILTVVRIGYAYVVETPSGKRFLSFEEGLYSTHDGEDCSYSTGEACSDGRGNR